MTITDTTNYYKKERKTGIGGLPLLDLLLHREQVWCLDKGKKALQNDQNQQNLERIWLLKEKKNCIGLNPCLYRSSPEGSPTSEGQGVAKSLGKKPQTY